MDLLPLFLDLRGRDVLLVGAGEVAARKLRLLRSAGARVTVVAPEACAEIAALAAEGAVQWRREAFAAPHAAGRALIIAATDDPALNLAVAAAGRANNVFVNAVDDVAASSAVMPSIVDRSPVIVAIGSGGNAPSLARRLRSRIEALLPAQLGALAAAAGRWRERVKATLPDVATRRRFWDRWFDQAAALRASGDQPLDAALDEALARALQESAGVQPGGQVWLIGAGPGDPDLLTLRALQLLQECDVVLYDRLVSDAVLERVRRDAERVYVGKEPGYQRSSQSRIHELLLQYAQRGLRVARLKGGDPLVFGRGGEEIEALCAAGIPVTVVPGVTAALGAAAGAGIPLTHRGVSQSVTYVTAMGEAAGELDWRALAAPLQTVVFYMGVAQLPRIVERLQAHGAPAERGAAVVERATLPGQRVITGPLAAIAALAASANVQAPALLIVGDVVYRRA